MGKSVRKVNNSFFESEPISSKTVDASFFEEPVVEKKDELVAPSLFDWRPKGAPSPKRRLDANFNTTAPDISQPAVEAPAPKKINQFESSKEKLERDIDLSMSFRLGANYKKDGADTFTLSPISPITSAPAPNEAGQLEQADIPEFSLKSRMKSAEEFKREKKNLIMSDPDALNEYRQKRLRELDMELAAVQDNTRPMFGSASNEAPEVITEESLMTDLKRNEIRSQKETFVNDIKQVASVVVPSTFIRRSELENSEIDLRKMGEEYLRVTGAPTYKDQKDVLEELTKNENAKVRKIVGKSDDVVYEDMYNKDDLQFTKQGIEYEFEKTGADLLKGFNTYQAESLEKKINPQVLDLTKSVLTAIDNATTAEERDQYGQQFRNILRENSDVNDYVQYLISAADANQKGEELLNKFPQVKRREQRKQLNDAFFSMTDLREDMLLSSPDMMTKSSGMGLTAWNSLFGSKATEEDAEYLSQATGISVDEVKKAINEGDFWNGYKIKTVGGLGGVAEGLEETAIKMGMGAKRLLGTQNVATENKLTSDALNMGMTKASANKLIDDKGEWNVNPTSIMNAMGYGVGQTTAFAIPTLISGGTASGLGGAGVIKRVVEAGTTIASAMAGSAEDAYQEAARHTSDESVRRGYMFITALENSLPELIMSPADIVRKVAGKSLVQPTGRAVENTFQVFANEVSSNGLEATMKMKMKNFAKELGNVVLAENVEEAITNFTNNATKEDMLGVKMTSSEVANQAFETFVHTTLSTLPLGIGAGLGSTSDMSGVRKQALFEGGSEPQLYAEKLRKLRDAGTLSDEQFNEKVSVLNTMQSIVSNLPKAKPNGQELSYEEKATLAAQQFRIEWNNKRLQQNPLAAEKTIIEQDNKEAENAQAEILNIQSPNTNENGNSEKSGEESRKASEEGSSQEGSTEESGKESSGSQEGSAVTNEGAVGSPAAPSFEEQRAEIERRRQEEIDQRATTVGTTGDQSTTGVDNTGEPTQAPEVAEYVAPKEEDTISVPSAYGGDISYTFRDGAWQYQDSRGKWLKEYPKQVEKIQAQWDEQKGNVTPTPEPNDSIDAAPIDPSELTDEEVFEQLTPEEQTSYLSHLEDLNIEEAKAIINGKRPAKATEAPVAETEVDSFAPNAPKGIKASEDTNAIQEKYKGDRRVSTVIKQAKEAVTTLKSVLPDFDIHIHETQEEYNAAMVEMGGVAGSAGNFAYQKSNGAYRGRIDINLANANNRTVAHEVTHGILLKKFGEDSKQFKQFRDAISKAVSEEDNQELRNFVENYSEGQQAEEYLAELSGKISANGETLKPSTLQKIADVINKFVFKLTGGKVRPFPNVHAGKSLISFFNEMSSAIAAGRELNINDNETTQTQERSDATTVSKAQRNTTEAKAKRSQIEDSIKSLRDKGLLKNSSATGAMTNDEINAQMELTDAMASVWFETTGRDDFYETFFNEVKEGDISTFENYNGVLYQDAAGRTRVTLGVFENVPQLQKMKGQNVAVQSITDLIKSKGKQIEKDLINMVLGFDKYKGQKRIPFDEFRNDVETHIMKLEKIRTNSYASYGMGNLGDDESYGRSETIIFNSPIEHGETGHFSSDFKPSQLDEGNREWELRQLPNTDQWAAVDKNMPAGVTAETLAAYVGTAGSRQDVEAWIEQRNVRMSDSSTLNVGLFGHIRVWKNEDITTIAELQSDYFQKNKASDLLKESIPQEEIDEYMNSQVWKPLDDKFVAQMKEASGVYTQLEGEEIKAYSKDGVLLTTYYVAEQPPAGLQRGDMEERAAVVRAMNVLSDRNVFDYDGEDGKVGVKVSSFSEKETNKLFIFDTRKEANAFMNDIITEANYIKDVYERLRLEYRNEQKLRNGSEKKYVEKRIEELRKNNSKADMLAQFIASAKVHELRLFREAIKEAAEAGASIVRFPAPYTLAVIEGYVDKTGEGNTPYDIVRGDSDGLSEGDIIDYGGDKFIVIESSGSDFSAAPKDKVFIWDRDSLI
jgi:hypothetical protein